MNRPLVKIKFNLCKDTDYYPPFDAEWLWGEELGHNLFRIDSIPFFVKKVSIDNIIDARLNESGDYVYNKSVSYSGHQTVRILLKNEEMVPEIREKISSLGGFSEISHMSNLISVDIPRNSNIEKLREILNDGEQRGDWEVEEASIWW